MPPFKYEFGGPCGAFVAIFTLPAVILLLAYWSDVGEVETDNILPTPRPALYDLKRPFWETIVRSHVLWPCQADDVTRISKMNALYIVIAWILFQVVLERLLPYERVEGTPITKRRIRRYEDGRSEVTSETIRLVYRINGHLAFWVTMLTVAIGYPYYEDKKYNAWQLKSWDLTFLYYHFSELAFASILCCLVLSLYLYIDSYFGSSNNRIAAQGGTSNTFFYDYFIGRPLNPRIFDFDWKEFCELRPGLIGWVLLNLASAQQQKAELGYITGSMYLIIIFQGIYVWDALYQEKAILTTMDITTDGFGYMLVLGDLAWVPFTYSLQARYLVKHDPHLSHNILAGIVALYLLGYYIFRSANSQKDAFRRNPYDPRLGKLSFMKTDRGTKLLTSGWWGMARKINYTGDWIMGLSWCLVCGFDSIVPYYYAIYFAILLVHRSMRDDHFCQQKYGKDWDEYKKRVPYRFVPFVV